jgi:hypothetical protein
MAEPHNLGLICSEPYIDLILEGKKVWDIRSSTTKVRGEIYLIRSGSATIVGTCRIADCTGPYELTDLVNKQKYHQIPAELLYGKFSKYKRLYSWHLDDVCAWKVPVKYNHPNGAVIWVKLDKLID